MKFQWKKAWWLIAIVVAVFLGSAVSANTPLPGSAEDPLITKSYMDQYVNQIRAELKREIEAEFRRLGSAGGLDVVLLKAGETIIGQAGTEFIVRTGRVNVVEGPAGGLPDLTAGADIRADVVVPLNHQLMVPRSDGRGLRVPSGSATIMVRGNYNIIPFVE
jgi:hypothetical protein